VISNTFFKDVYVSPGLSNNLLSVGQLVEENYDVHFSRDGCLLQDQVSGTILTKGPKVGRLFPLHFSIPRSLSLACITVNNPSEVLISVECCTFKPINLYMLIP
jgi:hypothetical protein